MITFAVATAGLFLAGATAQASTGENDPVTNGVVTIQVTKLTQAQAAARLRAAGITWSSSGNCSDRNNSTCTSFEQVNLTTIQGAETLKHASGCALNITGGHVLQLRRLLSGRGGARSGRHPVGSAPAEPPAAAAAVAHPSPEPGQV